MLHLSKNTAENFNDSLQIPDDYEQLLASPQREASENEGDMSIEEETEHTPENSDVSSPIEIPIVKPRPLSFCKRYCCQSKNRVHSWGVLMKTEMCQ